MNGTLSSTILTYLLTLPVILLSLSIHETAHGLMADKLGDRTARSLGRLTLNPIKHIDPFGFLCMLLFHFGWAKPVPVNARNFKNPRRDMALTAAAGPVSNLLTSLVFALLLMLDVTLAKNLFAEDLQNAFLLLAEMETPEISTGFAAMSVITYILYMGVLLNINLAIFNLIPIPPFDGSRIFYIFLPQKFYFAIMKYERYIMIAILVLLWIAPGTVLTRITSFLATNILKLFGFGGSGENVLDLNILLAYISSALF